mmetsp:Transcript_49121/g.122018  ORF Transcript_49121/g.122018 Transcript_49121/m.122018 type:complete len:92 (+) Transcript_49121:1458-1733(+)
MRCQHRKCAWLFLLQQGTEQCAYCGEVLQPDTPCHSVSKDDEEVMKDLVNSSSQTAFPLISLKPQNEACFRMIQIMLKFVQYSSNFMTRYP